MESFLRDTKNNLQESWQLSIKGDILWHLSLTILWTSTMSNKADKICLLNPGFLKLSSFIFEDCVNTFRGYKNDNPGVD